MSFDYSISFASKMYNFLNVKAIGQLHILAQWAQNAQFRFHIGGRPHGNQLVKASGKRGGICLISNILFPMPIAH
jgi:hypothetical protein